MKLWFVDDKRDNHEARLYSFPAPVTEACELRSLFTVADA